MNILTQQGVKEAHKLSKDDFVRLPYEFCKDIWIKCTEVYKCYKCHELFNFRKGPTICMACGHEYLERL